MLRALASYFFGGIEDETPSIECETREVKDWLVVNLPDHSKDGIDLFEDDDASEIDDVEDIGNAMDEDEDDDAVEVDAYEMDSEDDDILLSVSYLMTPPDNERPPSELSNDQYSFDDSFSEQYPDMFTVAPPKRVLTFYDDNEKCFTRQTIEIIFPVQSALQRHKIFDDTRETLLDLILDRGLYKRAKRQEIVKEFGVHVHRIDLTPLPTYSKSYVNHRHPEKLLHQDILQRIKELEPQQQAVQRSAKKILTRGQLNRQNKNYMYETSSKRNRRSNRQRNHSGANNNRKC